jgi:chemotaxis regulatin CheY-phosphate phosphatase CheZ
MHPWKGWTMKKKDVVPVVRIEINSGTFTIPAGDKVYEITVRQSPTISETLDAIVVNELSSAGVDIKAGSMHKNTPEKEGSLPDDLQKISLYKEISEEMFKDIGRLARDLSISIKDLPSGYEKEVDFEKAGLDLESAKSMLEEVVNMTETATMTIMDISEDMQGQCAIISKTLDDVRALDFVGNAEPGTGIPKKKDPIVLMRDMLVNMKNLRDSLPALLGGPNVDPASVKEAISAIDAQVAMLEKEYSQQCDSSDRYMVVDESYSMVRKEDHDCLIAALESSDHVIQCIISNIGRILESLTFQDLSGQRIIKIVGLLSNVQIQLLSILVSSGVKLKYLREGKPIEKNKADAEVDELMNRFIDESNKKGNSKNVLDQGAIDSLLDDLGF